eukprot:gb/GECG01007390.1/.p1 GENE.gb/GECG01007390.1/~~gb/GECG01007390.1/.p1  ORF type:complete len:651 (+),score=47.88 gb/GECG01007390.1/:1-1953(+)
MHTLGVDDTRKVLKGPHRLFAFVTKCPCTHRSICLAYLLVYGQDSVPLDVNSLLAWSLHTMKSWYPEFNPKEFVSDKADEIVGAFTQFVSETAASGCEEALNGLEHLNFVPDEHLRSYSQDLNFMIESLMAPDISQGRLSILMAKFRRKYGEWSPAKDLTSKCFAQQIRLCLYHVKKAFKENLRGIEDVLRAAGTEIVTDPNFRSNPDPHQILSYNQLERRLSRILYAKLWQEMSHLWLELRQDMLSQGFQDHVQYLENEWFNATWIYSFCAAGYVLPLHMTTTNNFCEAHFSLIKRAFFGRRRQKSAVSLIIELCGDPEEPFSYFFSPSCSGILKSSQPNLRAIEPEAVSRHYKSQDMLLKHFNSEPADRMVKVAADATTGSILLRIPRHYNHDDYDSHDVVLVELGNRRSGNSCSCAFYGECKHILFAQSLQVSFAFTVLSYDTKAIATRHILQFRCMLEFSVNLMEQEDPDDIVTISHFRGSSTRAIMPQTHVRTRARQPVRRGPGRHPGNKFKESVSCSTARCWKAHTSAGYRRKPHRHSTTFSTSAEIDTLRAELAALAYNGAFKRLFQRPKIAADTLHRGVCGEQSSGLTKAIVIRRSLNKERDIADVPPNAPTDESSEENEGATVLSANTTKTSFTGRAPMPF